MRTAQRWEKLFRTIVAVAGPAAACGWIACSTGGDLPPDAGDDASVADGSRPDATDGGRLGLPETSPLDSYVEWCEAGPPQWIAWANECFNYLYVPCGLPAGDYADDAGRIHRCDQICLGYPGFNCELLTDATEPILLSALPDSSPFYDFDAASAPDGAVIVSCDCYGGGRRPTGLRKPRVRATTPLGAYFARMAHLEAASIPAFARVSAELEATGAPAALRAAAKRATRDEERHARVMQRLARRFGGEPARVRVRSAGARSLEAMARENAVEGCVRETYGALVATWQAAHAGDPAVQRAMRAIARDETRHAALSAEVERFYAGKLDVRARARVGGARRKALATLAEELRVAPHPELVSTAGVPSAETARRLFQALSSTLWA